MAISYISSAGAEATSVAMPSHLSRDLIIAIAYNSANTTVPTIPTGWLAIASNNANSRASAVAYKIASSDSETSGTWTSANFVSVAVYRTSLSVALLVGNIVKTQGSNTTTINYAVNLVRNSQSWTAGLIGLKSISLENSTGDAAPSGMSQRINTVGVSAVGVETAIADTNTASGNWPATAVTSNMNVSYHSYVVELFESDISTGSGVRIPNVNGGADQ